MTRETSYYSYLACPFCHSSLDVANPELLQCTNSKCKKTFQIIEGIPNFLEQHSEESLEISKDKWNDFYEEMGETKDIEESYELYLKNNYQNVFDQLSQCHEISNDTIFLEIGCGPMFLGRALSDKCNLVIGIDFSLPALLMAKRMLEAHKITNYLLILGDIKKMPLKDSVIDVLYGGGVLEHFKDTETAVREFHRVVSAGGVSFNTVPMLNIGSLTYRQLWGNIPNAFLLRELAEFVHIKLLKSRHMKFGYELSFTRRFLKQLHKKCGFSTVSVGNFETILLFEFIPAGKIKKLFIWLAENSPLFWPMVKVIGKKE